MPIPTVCVPIRPLASEFHPVSIRREPFVKDRCYSQRLIEAPSLHKLARHIQVEVFK